MDKENHSVIIYKRPLKLHHKTLVIAAKIMLNSQLQTQNYALVEEMAIQAGNQNSTSMNLSENAGYSNQVLTLALEELSLLMTHQSTQTIITYGGTTTGIHPLLSKLTNIYQRANTQLLFTVEKIAVMEIWMLDTREVKKD